mgnify:CR=1 FL=1
MTGVQTCALPIFTLGYEDRYVGVLGYRTIKVGSVSYRTILSHGQSAGMDQWRDAKKLVGIYPDADVVMLSHTHEMGWSNMAKMTSETSQKRIHFLRTGSVLNYPRYAQQAMYQPKVKGFTVAYFDDTKKEIKADISGDRL